MVRVDEPSGARCNWSNGGGGGGSTNTSTTTSVAAAAAVRLRELTTRGALMRRRRQWCARAAAAAARRVCCAPGPLPAAAVGGDTRPRPQPAIGAARGRYNVLPPQLLLPYRHQILLAAAVADDPAGSRSPVYNTVAAYDIAAAASAAVASAAAVGLCARTYIRNDRTLRLIALPSTPHRSLSLTVSLSTTKSTSTVIIYIIIDIYCFPRISILYAHLKCIYRHY